MVREQAVVSNPNASYGNRITKSLENGTMTSYSYDMASRLTQVAHSAGSINLATVGYTLNAVGNRTQKAVVGLIVNRTESYTFDLVDQLTGVTYGGGLTAGYEYDPVGNRTSVTGSVPGIT